MLVVIIRLGWTIYQLNVGESWALESGAPHTPERVLAQPEHWAPLVQTIGQWTENHKIELQSPKVNGTMILAATFTPRDVNFNPWEWLTMLLLKRPTNPTSFLFLPIKGRSPPSVIRTNNDLSYFRKAPWGKEGWYRLWVPQQAAAQHCSPTFSQSPY